MVVEAARAKTVVVEAEVGVEEVEVEAAVAAGTATLATKLEMAVVVEEEGSVLARELEWVAVMVAVAAQEKVLGMG